jgi:hypothetical protein
MRRISPGFVASFTRWRAQCENHASPSSLSSSLFACLLTGLTRSRFAHVNRTSTNTFSRITPTTTTTYRQPSYDPSPSTTIVVRPTDVAAQAAGQSTYDLARESSRSVAAAASSTLSTDGALWTRVSTIASSESDQRPLGTPGAQVSDSKSGGGTDG